MVAPYAAIIVNRAVQAVNKTFHYRIPASLAGKVQLGQVVQIPFGREIMEGIVVELLTQTDVAEETMREIQAIVSPMPLFQQDLLQLSSYLAEYYFSTRAAFLQAMLPAGLALTGHLPKSSQVELFYWQENGQAVKTAKQKAVRDFLLQNPGVQSREILEATGVSRAVLQKLCQMNHIEKKMETVWAQQNLKSDLDFGVPQALTDEQQKALAQMAQNAQTVRKPVLLQGVTGSGKTEVYLRFLQPILAAGKQAIVLVPEIALTPQMVAYFRSRLQVAVAVLHSGLSQKERRETWMGIAKGIYPLVIGARSAIFAPTPNLGAVIIDEVHEPSYKQENQPCFHALVAAEERCCLQNAQLLAGSATPPVTLYERAKKGEWQLIQLKQRVHNLPLPQVNIVDMRRELQMGNRSIFSGLLKGKITAALAQKEQVILFLNRRGYHTFVSCRACGKAIQCRHCAVPLAYHQESGRLKCHYCGYQEEMPACCPNCGSTAIRQFGVGTQKVSEAVQKLWPQAKVLRLDRDATAKRGSHETIYRTMYQGGADILVGTQMVVKGLDFPKVNLVGVLAADASLYLPELFAEERTFQLLTQVAGRAGRRDKTGEVVIQTYQPGHHLLREAAKQDYVSFYEQEIASRRLMDNPPYSVLIRLLCTATDQQKAMYSAEMLASFIKLHITEEERLLGPQEAPLAKIKDRFRVQIILKGQKLPVLRQHLQQALAEFYKCGKMIKDTQVVVDVEPLTTI